MMSKKPTCLGSGLVALDVIYDDKDHAPKFLAGGTCGNVLTILSYLGWESYPLARLGKDTEGDRIIEDMKRWDVRTRFIEQDVQINSPRIIQRIFLGKEPYHRFYLKCTHGNWLPRRRPFTLKSLKMIKDKLPKSNVFYFDRASPSALDMAKTLKQQGAIIIFEPQKFLHDDNFLQCLKIADVVKYCYTQSEKVKELNVRIPLEIQTKGKEGLRYRARFLQQIDWIHMDAFLVSNLVDASGSGDWLTAGLIYGLIQNKSKYTITRKKLESALKFGQALASLNCNFVGARGMMYYIHKSHLFRLVDEVIASNEAPKIKSLPKSRIKLTSMLTLKCKTCLCSN